MIPRQGMTINEEYEILRKNMLELLKLLQQDEDNGSGIFSDETYVKIEKIEALIK